MLKLVLTDGQLTCNALEMEKLERIGYFILDHIKQSFDNMNFIIYNTINIYFSVDYDSFKTIDYGENRLVI